MTKQKPEVESTKEVGCVLEVEGYIWAGGKAKYAYSIDANKPPKTYQDCKRIAGDFESLTSAKVITCVTVSKMTVTTKAII